MKQRWKFLILGITGDLSKRKILPSITEFAHHNNDKISVDLLGYSRSEPNTEEILNIIKNTTNGYSPFLNIDYATGQYNDPAFFNNLIRHLSKDERLIIYFAVPPVVILDLLEIFCPFNTKNIEILIEKPFGNNKNEAEQIIAKINSCKLNNKVHFCDHYLFKSGLIINPEIQLLINTVKQKQIEKIEIIAKESIGVKGRAGYYDSVGAIKDMFPSHLYSIWKFCKKTFHIKEKIQKINIVKIGQYKNYFSDIEVKQSNTETYFKIEFETNKGMKVLFESGKRFDRKETIIKVNFSDGNAMQWEIDPDRKILYQGKTYLINQSLHSDHYNIFYNLLNNNYSKFINQKSVIRGWDLYNKTVDYINTNSVKTEVY
jgi:glucose-6-phosphate 1-dehydrogenase